MNLAGGCKTATMKLDHEMKQSAYHVNTVSCHAVNQPPDDFGLNFPHSAG